VGGTVALTIRFPDSTEFRMLRWTNILPWAFNNVDFLIEKSEHLVALMEQYHTMKADWDKHVSTGAPLEYNMTSCYFPDGKLVPSGYGLVVVDMVNKVILSSQGYTHLGQEHGRLLEDTEDPDDTYSERRRMRMLIESRRIRYGVFMGKDGREIKRTITSLQEYEDRPKNTYLKSMPIDMNPYTVIDYEEYTASSQVDLRRQVLTLGFTLSDEEEEGWDDWISERCQE